MKNLQELWCDDQGQDVVEYVLIAALFSTLTIAAMRQVGNALLPLWDRVARTIAAA